MSLVLREPRDIREGGSWSLSQRAKNDALWALASLALAATRSLPRDAMRRLGRALGLLAHAVARPARRTALSNVMRVFPDLDPSRRDALVRRCFVTLGELLGDTVASLHSSRVPTPPLEVTRRALELMTEARAEGRGVVFASAHLGPWERVAASLVAAGVPLVTMARESYDPRFNKLYEDLRGRQGVGMVWRATPSAAGRMLRTLRAGHVLGVPMDLRSRVASREVPFLGHAASTAVGPARLALRARAPVVVGTAAPGEAEDLVVTATRIETGDLAADDDGTLELTRRINAELSDRILALPHAWVWMHDRWRPSTAPRSGV